MIKQTRYAGRLPAMSEKLPMSVGVRPWNIYTDQHSLIYIYRTLPTRNEVKVKLIRVFDTFSSAAKTLRAGK